MANIFGFSAVCAENALLMVILREIRFLVVRGPVPRKFPTLVKTVLGPKSSFSRSAGACPPRLLNFRSYGYFFVTSKPGDGLSLALRFVDAVWVEQKSSFSRSAGACPPRVYLSGANFARLGYSVSENLLERFSFLPVSMCILFPLGCEGQALALRGKREGFGQGEGQALALRGKG